MEKGERGGMPITLVLPESAATGSSNTRGRLPVFLPCVYIHIGAQCHKASCQGCHWTSAKITENLRVRAVSQKMNTKRDRKFRKRKMK